MDKCPGGDQTCYALNDGGVGSILAAAVIFGSRNLGRKLTATSLMTGDLFYLAYVGYVIVVGTGQA